MTYPASGFTFDWYDTLPDAYRVADRVESSGGGQPLLRFLDVLGEPAQEVVDLYEAADSGGLTDPVTAPAKVLPWLAGMLGVRLQTGLSEPDQRDAIADAVNGWRAGTPAAIAAAARPALIGSRHCEVRSGVAPWTILLRVKGTDVPGTLDDVAAAVVAAGAKPAGFRLVVEEFTPGWGAVDGFGTTWGQVDAAAGGKWATLDGAGT